MLQQDAVRELCYKSASSGLCAPSFVTPVQFGAHGNLCVLNYNSEVLASHRRLPLGGAKRRVGVIGAAAQRVNRRRPAGRQPPSDRRHRRRGGRWKSPPPAGRSQDVAPPGPT